ncbi:oleosin G [Quercus robur]|uniref:oleosin G n=1 Tax=Quercus robur TaxID=38942 RepID=UPI00216203C5|nr:oleosin G [Quercus robur]
MADRPHQNSAETQNTRAPRSPQPNHSITFSNSNTSAFLRTLKDHAPNSSQLVGLLSLLISGSILLLLAGLTVTATVLGVIFFTPLILFTSPIWFPIGAFLFVVTAAFVSLCGFGVALVGGLSWIYRYFRGMHPPGSDRFDYARSRIYDTASHVKDYATQYGGYLQSKVKDAAPGA